MWLTLSMKTALLLLVLAQEHHFAIEKKILPKQNVPLTKSELRPMMLTDRFHRYHKMMTKLMEKLQKYVEKRKKIEQEEETQNKIFQIYLANRTQTSLIRDFLPWRF